MVGRKNRKLVTDVDLYDCLYKNENNYFYISQTDKRRFVELMNTKYYIGVSTIIQESQNEINERERQQQEGQEEGQEEGQAEGQDEDDGPAETEGCDGQA